MSTVTSFAAECAFKRECAHSYDTVHFNRNKVIQVARTLPKERKQKGMHALLQEYGSQEAIPTGEFIDVLFALDIVLNIGGELVGVDFTLNAAKVYEKQNKLATLSRYHAGLGIHRTVVYCKEVHGSLENVLF